MTVHKPPLTDDAQLDFWSETITQATNNNEGRIDALEAASAELDSDDVVIHDGTGGNFTYTVAGVTRPVSTGVETISVGSFDDNTLLRGGQNWIDSDNYLATALAIGNEITSRLDTGLATKQDTLTNGDITTSLLADSAVDSGKIADDAVTTGKVDDDAITSAKIASGGVGTDNLADDSVTTSKLADGAVNNDRIANTTIGVGKMNASGTPSSNTFLRGDGTWSVPPGGGGVAGSNVPNFPTGITDDTSQSYVLEVTDSGGTETAAWATSNFSFERDGLTYHTGGTMTLRGNFPRLEIRDDGGANIDARIRLDTLNNSGTMRYWADVGNQGGNTRHEWYIDNTKMATMTVDGDIQLHQNGQGLIMTSPDGNTTKRVFLNNSGNLATEDV